MNNYVAPHKLFQLGEELGKIENTLRLQMQAMEMAMLMNSDEASFVQRKNNSLLRELRNVNIDIVGQLDEIAPILINIHHLEVLKEYLSTEDIEEPYKD